MKKRFLIALCAVALTLGGAAAAFADLAPGTGVVDSKHDMLNYTINNSGTPDEYERVCAYCHTPHHAIEDSNSDYLPLWSRTVTATDFDPYTSATFSQAGLFTDPVIGPSRLCMGCHDGVVAIDAYYGAVGTPGLTEGDGWGEIGIGIEPNTLTNDHPIGFSYLDAQTADGAANLHPATNAFAGGTVIADVLYDDGTGAGKEIMTCATCHDVHNGPEVDDSDDNTGWFLYGTQTDSGFCTTCHNK
ncbi:MAG: cytochrome C [Desulfuromonas sp.]|uniref:hypothetical protein n=1 Tax=Desulfuromonas sp. TaxID=892 RepID=UPI000CB6E08A|nr:hypothetical protein [Desulfuromonas sp.]PLX86530.1 MAG: cytochrome C [Desulfuromonas sp.]